MELVCRIMRAMVVFSEGASASARRCHLQTATSAPPFRTGLCDRFASVWRRRKYFTPWRITGALFVIATIFVVSPQSGTNPFILARYPPFGMVTAGWQPAMGLRKVAEATGSTCWCPLHGIPSSAFVSRRGAGDTQVA